jgi:predicted RNA-binding Zn-ribbon protein involved in translation (DUF1610 family)
MSERPRRHGRVVERSEARGLDRVEAPDPSRPRQGDVKGRRALYSVDSTANPTPVVIVRCPACGVERGLTIQQAGTLLRPPFVMNPLSRRMWTRCPTCGERAWLRVERGPGVPWPFRPRG